MMADRWRGWLGFRLLPSKMRPNRARMIQPSPRHIVEGLDPSVGPNEMRNVIELLCTSDLALKFGAVEPRDIGCSRSGSNCAGIDGAGTA
jgi:hypothetical protein